jgi:hypothetical protein
MHAVMVLTRVPSISLNTNPYKVGLLVTPPQLTNLKFNFVT